MKNIKVGRFMEEVDGVEINGDSIKLLNKIVGKPLLIIFSFGLYKFIKRK